MERDDVIEYSLYSHHSEEEGKKIRKKIWFVTALLSIITIVEVALGVWGAKEGISWTLIKWTFIGLTVIKAGYIVLVFMHLGDELKHFRYIILVPYVSFILYLIYILVVEADFIWGV